MSRFCLPGALAFDVLHIMSANRTGRGQGMTPGGGPGPIP